MLAGAAGILGGCGGGGRASLMLVGSGAGSASDGLARLAARFLEARSGERIAVENEARAGGKLAAERLARAKPDGRLLAFLPTGLLYAALLDEPGVRWSLPAFAWIGSLGSDRRVLITTAGSGVRRFAQLIGREQPLLLPATSASSPGYYEPLIVRHLTGARLKPVPGFVGGARNHALVAGEADAIVGSLDGLRSVLELPGSQIILRLNDLPLPDGRAAPTLAAFARGPDAGPLLALVEAHARLGRIAALPPRTPAPVLAEWRRRFAALAADPAFRSEALARGYLIELTPGEAVAARVGALLGGDAAGVGEALRRALSPAGRGPAG